MTNQRRFALCAIIIGLHVKTVNLGTKPDSQEKNMLKKSPSQIRQNRRSKAYLAVLTDHSRARSDTLPGMVFGR